MEERHRHCTKFVTRGGYIEIFLVIRYCICGRLSKYSSHKMSQFNAFKNPATLRSSVLFIAFLCIVIDFTRSHASTYKDNYVSWSRREMKGGHFIFYKTPRKCTLKWLFGRALHVARNNIIPASFYRLFQQLYWSRLF